MKIFNKIKKWFTITLLDEELFNRAEELVKDVNVEEEKIEKCDHRWYTIKYHINRDIHRPIRGGWDFMYCDRDDNFRWYSKDIPEEDLRLAYLFPVDKVCLKCGKCHNGWDIAMEQIQAEMDKVNADEELAHTIWKTRCCK